MELTKNQKKELHKIGMYFDTIEDFILYVKPQLDYLITHNKNYTKAQFETLDTLNDIIHALYKGLQNDTHNERRETMKRIVYHTNAGPAIVNIRDIWQSGLYIMGYIDRLSITMIKLTDIISIKAI